MKKLASIIMFCMITVLTVTIVNAEDCIRVMIDNSLVQFDTQPTIVEGRTIVPLRAIFEGLGSTVEWDNEKQKVIATKNNTTIELIIGDRHMRINDRDIELDVAASVINGRTYVPVRAIAEAFGTDVIWDDKNKTVLIHSDEYQFSYLYNSSSEDAKYYSETSVPNFSNIVGGTLICASYLHSMDKTFYYYSQDYEKVKVYEAYLLENGFRKKSNTFEDDEFTTYGTYTNDDYIVEIVMEDNWGPGLKTTNINVAKCFSIDNEGNEINTFEQKEEYEEKPYYKDIDLLDFGYLYDQSFIKMQYGYLYSYDEANLNDYLSRLKSDGWESKKTSKSNYDLTLIKGDKTARILWIKSYGIVIITSEKHLSATSNAIWEKVDQVVIKEQEVEKGEKEKSKANGSNNNRKEETDSEKIAKEISDNFSLNNVLKDSTVSYEVTYSQTSIKNNIYAEILANNEFIGKWSYLSSNEKKELKSLAQTMALNSFRRVINNNNNLNGSTVSTAMHEAYETYMQYIYSIP